MTKTPPPFALFIRGPNAQIMTLSDQLGFEMEMQALAVSVFEDSEDTMHVQALYGSEAEAKTALAGLDIGAHEHFIVQLPDEDWTALSQAGLPPVQAGRFFVYGAHDSGKVPGDTPYPVQIEAGIAFGTGHHGTTKGCLLAFEHLADREDSVLSGDSAILDLGCGTGVLAIAAAKCLSAPVTASDIDQDAVDVTADNAILNGVEWLVAPVLADGLDAPELTRAAAYNLIFANILAGPLIGLAPDIAKALASKGHVILSGILDEQAQTVQAAYEAEGLKAVYDGHLTGWTTLIMQSD